MSIWCVLRPLVGSPQPRSGRQLARVIPESPWSQRHRIGAACDCGGPLAARDVSRYAAELESGPERTQSMSGPHERRRRGSSRRCVRSKNRETAGVRDAGVPDFPRRSRMPMRGEVRHGTRRMASCCHRSKATSLKEDGNDERRACEDLHGLAGRRGVSCACR